MAKQSYSLPARPDLSGGAVMNGGSAAPSEPPAQNVEAISNSTLQSGDNMGAPVQSSGFLGAPQPLATGVLEGNEPPAAAPASSAPAVSNAAPAAASAAPAASNGGADGYVVQVGALNDPARAQQMMKSLSQRYGVPGKVEDAGNNVYRVQLGGYTSRAEAAALQQRLSSEGHAASFITNTRR